MGRRKMDFLKEVEQGLKSAEKYVQLHAANAQQHVRDCNCGPGLINLRWCQQCLIWQPDTTASHMFAKWNVITCDIHHLRTFSQAVNDALCANMSLGDDYFPSVLR